MKVIRKLLTEKEVIEIVKKTSGYIKGVVPIKLDFLIKYDSETFYEGLVEKLVGKITFQDVNISVLV